MEARGGGSFSELLREVGQNAVQELRGAEQLSAKAAAKEADLLEVVTAVNNAEVTLQTVVAVRDRVIQAYQDIIRMPICAAGRATRERRFRSTEHGEFPMNAADGLVVSRAALIVPIHVHAPLLMIVRVDTIVRVLGRVM